MTTFRTWLEAIDSNNFGPWTREMLIREGQRTHFVGSLPAGFTFLLGAIVDLGFERLGLSDPELREVRLAFIGGGVAVPGTLLRLRCFRPTQSVVEPNDGTEKATLPNYWRQGVLVLGHDEKYTWVGKRVGLNRLRVADHEYEDAGDAWVLKAREIGPPGHPAG